MMFSQSWKISVSSALSCIPHLHSSSVRERMQMSRRSLGDFRLPCNSHEFDTNFNFLFCRGTFSPSWFFRCFYGSMQFHFSRALHCALFARSRRPNSATLTRPLIPTLTTLLCSLHCIFMHNWLLLTFFSFCSLVLSYFLHFANCNLLLLLFFFIECSSEAAQKNKKQIHFDILSRIRARVQLKLLQTRGEFSSLHFRVSQMHCWMQQCARAMAMWSEAQSHFAKIHLRHLTLWDTMATGCLVARCVHRLARVSAAFWAQREKEQHSENKKAK